AAAFVKRGEEQIGSRTALVYHYTVNQPNSHWRVVAEDRSYNPAYKGSIWIDKDTSRVLRIEQQSLSLPDDFPFDKVEGVLDYNLVRIEAAAYLLPVRGENLMCQRGTNTCSRNEIHFRNYRKFTAESEIILQPFRSSL
ncbi:MAG: hypothetical protein ACRD7E_18795, partial [Bryobacteraceae bacterium]